ncbi:hypothetical protein TRVL_06163 [Trypanosoma vivax]|nr:hypothetical protein TRVL_06163 [Trypanosoma vivax]
MHRILQTNWQPRQGRNCSHELGRSQAILLRIANHSTRKNDKNRHGTSTRRIQDPPHWKVSRYGAWQEQNGRVQEREHHRQSGLWHNSLHIKGERFWESRLLGAERRSVRSQHRNASHLLAEVRDKAL